MGRILDPNLKILDERWSPTVTALLDDLGKKMWKSNRVRRRLFQKPEIIIRHLVEGPVQKGHKILWALSHTSIPSAFNAQGELEEGLRFCWIVVLDAQTSTFKIVGIDTIDNIAFDDSALRQAIEQAHKQGPKKESFYGNKGPLSHTAAI